MDILLLIGIILLLGQTGANLLRKIKIPQVVAYILMGVLLGRSVLNWIDPAALKGVTSIALGLIGFTIGSQLKLYQLRRMGRSIIWISFFEAFGAFFLVGISVWLLTGRLFEALIFGALASATAPAATVDVLEEYKCKGVLTTTLLAVVGIDDGIALMIYGFAQPFSKMLYMPDSGITIWQSALIPLTELGGSIVVGVVLGFFFAYGLKYFTLPGERLSVTLAIVLLATGISIQYHFSLILTNMIVGLVVGNVAMNQSRRIGEVVSGFTPPVYILFFALVGARLDISLLPTMGLLGVIYIITRGIGKIGGAWLGARIGGAPLVVRKYLGFGLFSQAGVAIGLAIAASNDFATAGPAGKEFGLLVINTITATTFVAQMVGPSLTRMAVVKAGETNLRR